MAEWSGEVEWSRETFPVSAGSRKFKWIYMKDSNGSYGDDCCWIDDVQFPSAHTTTFLPVLDLEAQVDENKVTLTWEAQESGDDYIIRRDGLPITTQHETTFTEWLNLGTYTYSVTAVSAEGSQSIPAFVTVDITAMGIDSVETELRVFPNPIRNYLNVSCGQPFRYAIFNNIGQLVKEGASMGEAHIECGTLRQGVYVLQISTEDQAIKKKIIIE